MNSKLLFLTCAVLALLGAAPIAMADGEARNKGTASNASEPNSAAGDLFQQLANTGGVMPDAGDVLEANDLNGEFFPEDDEDSTGGDGVKYVYKGAGSDITLGRPIRDYRVDDGYVQGLMQQRGSE